MFLQTFFFFKELVKNGAAVFGDFLVQCSTTLIFRHFFFPNAILICEDQACCFILFSEFIFRTTVGASGCGCLFLVLECRRSLVNKFSLSGQLEQVRWILFTENKHVLDASNEERRCGRWCLLFSTDRWFYWCPSYPTVLLVVNTGSLKSSLKLHWKKPLQILL